MANKNGVFFIQKLEQFLLLHGEVVTEPVIELLASPFSLSNAFTSYGADDNGLYLLVIPVQENLELLRTLDSPVLQAFLMDPVSYNIEFLMVCMGPCRRNATLYEFMEREGFIRNTEHKLMCLWQYVNYINTGVISEDL